MAEFKMTVVDGIRYRPEDAPKRAQPKAEDKGESKPKPKRN